MRRLCPGWILISIVLIGLYFSTYEEIEVRDGCCTYARITGWGRKKEFECQIILTNIVKMSVLNRGYSMDNHGFRYPRHSVVVSMTDGRRFEIKGLAGRGGASRNHCNEILRGLRTGRYHSRIYCYFACLYLLPFSLLFVFWDYMRFGKGNP